MKYHAQRGVQSRTVLATSKGRGRNAVTAMNVTLRQNAQVSRWF